jgi:hypothetical protein
MFPIGGEPGTGPALRGHHSFPDTALLSRAPKPFLLCLAAILAGFEVVFHKPDGGAPTTCAPENSERGLASTKEQGSMSKPI